MSSKCQHCVDNNSIVLVVCTRPTLRAAKLLVNVIFAVVSSLAVVARGNCDLRQLAAALSVVVILADIHIAQYCLLIFHDTPPTLKCIQFLPNDTLLTNL